MSHSDLHLVQPFQHLTFPSSHSLIYKSCPWLFPYVLPPLLLISFGHPSFSLNAPFLSILTSAQLAQAPVSVRAQLPTHLRGSLTWGKQVNTNPFHRVCVCPHWKCAMCQALFWKLGILQQRSKEGSCLHGTFLLGKVLMINAMNGHREWRTRVENYCVQMYFSQIRSPANPSHPCVLICFCCFNRYLRLDNL